MQSHSVLVLDHVSYTSVTPKLLFHKIAIYFLLKENSNKDFGNGYIKIEIK